MKLRDRVGHRGLHGRDHIDKRRRHALLMVRTAQVRVAVWAVMLLSYAFNVSGVHHLYSTVSFVTILSVLALLLTDWGQYAASSAELAAEDAHHDTEKTRAVVEVDTAQVEADVARLAELQPGPEAKKLASEIKQRLQRGTDE